MTDRTHPIGSLQNSAPTARRLVALGGVCVCLAACSTKPSYQQWGSMREVLRDGDTRARVSLAEVTLGHKSYGVGALAGLEGEVTIDAGQVWISRCLGPTEVTTTTEVGNEDAASMLFLGSVDEWTSTAVSTPVSPMELDAFIASAFADSGVHTGPRPFRIEGEFQDVRLHVIGGQCPIRARMHDEPMTKPAFELTLPHTSAVVVGIHSTNAPGDVTHMGSQTHMHVIVEHEGQTLTGHIESITLLPGSTLYVPAL